MARGQASAEKQVQSIIEFAKVVEMYQTKIEKIEKRVNTIDEVVDMALKELEFKNYKSVHNRLNYIKAIIGERTD